MLLEFSIKNYKSFKDKMTFSMLAAPKQKGLDYSVITKKIGSKTYKVLSSAIIYGPNASGKTNLREPDLLMVITGGELAYTRPDGVKIIPIGCLRD